MEEVVFRGIMMDAFEVEIGRSAACIAQATAFGAIHNHGVPAGTSGMLAAGVFGLLMGIIRYRTGGFISVCFCHFIVDLVIATWAVKSLVLIP